MRNTQTQNILSNKILAVILLSLGLLLSFVWFGAQAAAAADTATAEEALPGKVLDTGTSVEGGITTKANSEGFIFYYQIYDKQKYEIVISGYSYSGSGTVELRLPTKIQEDGQQQPYTVVGVNGNVFANCPYISGVTFGSTYQFVGAEAFMGCPLTTISLNQNGAMKTLNDRAFYRCKQLTNVTIPASVTSIGTGVFADCTSLNAITVVNGNQKYCGINGVLYTMSKDVLIQWPAALTVGSSIDSSCTIGAADCPVRVIGDKAFEGCIYLNKITDMYQTVNTIGEQAFMNCSGLYEVKIPPTVTTIGKQAFYGCAPGLVIKCDKASAAETFARNNGITTSVTCTVRFYDGSSLIKTEEVTMGGSASAPVLSERAGYTLTWDKDYTNVQQNLDVRASWKQNLTVTFKDAYSGQTTEMTSYYGGSVTPPVWTRTGYRLGWDTTAYTYVTKNLTVNAVWLVSMTDTPITEEAPAVGETRTINNITYQVTKASTSDPRVWAVGCTKQTMTTLTIPDRITFGGVSYKVVQIGKNAFRDMPRLTTLTIGKHVTRIKNGAFYNCPKLKNVTIRSKKIAGIGEKAFSKIYVRAKVDVPNSSVKKYKRYLLDAGLSTYAKVY